MSKKKWVAITVISIAFIVVIVKVTRIIQVNRHIKIEREAGILYKRAGELRSQGKWQESIQLYKELIEKYPGFSDITEVKFLVANTYRHQLLKFDEAAKYYEDVLKVKRRGEKGRRIPDTLIELAGIYRSQRRDKEAIELLKEAIDKYPTYVNKDWVYFQLQMLYEEIGEREKAKEMFLKRQKK